MYMIEPNVVIAVGAFDPLCSSDINYINEANKLGDVLIIALDSRTSFMTWKERFPIIQSIKGVDKVLEFSSETNDLKNIINETRKLYPYSKIKLAFSTPEHDTGIEFDPSIEAVYDVGKCNVEERLAILRRFSEYIRQLLELEAGPNSRYR